MRSNDAITLQLTANGLDTYCRELARRSPTLEKRVAAIDALTTFISSQTATGEQAKAEFSSIRQTLLDHLEQAREALLNDRAEHLRQALQTRHLPSIAALYTSLSRDAFWTLLGQVEARLDATASSSLHNWASGWLTQAKQRAQQASPYPDAVDLNAAGIDAAEYLAMIDLCDYLGMNTAEKGQQKG